MGIPQARKPDRTFRHTRPRTAMAAHGSPPSHRTMRHRDHATCTSITLDGPAPAGARRSLEHHATRDALPPQASCSPQPPGFNPASHPASSCLTRSAHPLAQHRPASRRYTSTVAATAASMQKHTQPQAAHGTRLGITRQASPAAAGLAHPHNPTGRPRAESAGPQAITPLGAWSSQQQPMVHDNHEDELGMGNHGGSEPTQCAQHRAAHPRRPFC